VRKLSRRQFLVGAAAAGLAVALPLRGYPVARPKYAAVPRVSVAGTNRVVHTHCSYVTGWDYHTGWYGSYVNQPVVDLMTDLGVINLTGTSTLANAWSAIIPSYVSGQKIAIKINLNNADCSDTDQIIDALPQPINSVIRGLKAIGVAGRRYLGLRRDKWLA